MPYRESQELFRLLLENGPHFLSDARWTLTRAYLPPWPSQDGAGRISINPGHSSLDDLGMPPWMRRTRQRPVFVLHDLIPLTNPEYCRAGERERHAARLDGLLRSGAGLVANSQATLDELVAFARERGLPVPPAVAAPLAPATLPDAAGTTPPLAEPYFVMVGTIEPRKNHLLLLHLWRDFARRFGDRAPRLVVIGQRGWECEQVVDMLERCEGLRGLVHERAGCSDLELARYLRHARALLFPSFAEGYGMPLVEALALGTPAIASTLPVFREVAGDVPDYLDPLDGPGWAQAILDYAEINSPRRAAQLQRMAGFRTPTWQRHFELVESLLERLG